MRSLIMRLLALALIGACSATALAQPGVQPALRIVVIAGEDAVNVIQQKTATRPVVEVRDRNNLPVAGALVTFSIGGGKAASFGGVSTLTVATNAAGQAAVTSLTPSAAGAFQIQVQAAFQGQLATATIAQTNVMTAAQAAAAGAATGGAPGSSAGSSGAAAGGAGGGGLSTTTIVATGAAIAGGAVAAVEVAKKPGGGEIFTGSFTGQTTAVSRFRDTGVIACVVTRAMTATIRMEINDKAEGRMTIKGTETFVANTCAFTQDPMDVDWEIAVNGSNSAIRAAETDRFSNSCCQGTNTMSFEGARNGNEISGTLRNEVRFTSTGEGGIQFDHLSTGSFPLTLTKSAQ
jgi:hypothetical protein